MTRRCRPRDDGTRWAGSPPSACAPGSRPRGRSFLGGLLPSRSGVDPSTGFRQPSRVSSTTFGPRSDLRALRSCFLNFHPDLRWARRRLVLGRSQGVLQSLAAVNALDASPHDGRNTAECASSPWSILRAGPRNNETEKMPGRPASVSEARLPRLCSNATIPTHTLFACSRVPPNERQAGHRANASGGASGQRLARCKCDVGRPSCRVQSPSIHTGNAYEPPPMRCSAGD